MKPDHFTSTVCIPCPQFWITPENKVQWAGSAGSARGVLIDHERRVTIENGVRTITNVNRKERRGRGAVGDAYEVKREWKREWKRGDRFVET